MQPSVTLPPEVLARQLARLVKTGGVILPDALYTLPETGRFIGRSTRHVKRLLGKPGCPLADGLHRDDVTAAGKDRLIKGSSIIDYQASIKVAG